MSKEERYSFFDHTADVGMDVFGNDLKELFKNAADGMFECIGQCKGKKDMQDIQIIDIETFDVVELLHDFLSELLFFFQNNYFYTNKIFIESISEKNIRAKAHGFMFEPNDNEFKADIKAVTYHQLNVEKVEGKYKARVIFDI